jgi:hypothetical protein
MNKVSAYIIAVFACLFIFVLYILCFAFIIRGIIPTAIACVAIAATWRGITSLAKIEKTDEQTETETTLVVQDSEIKPQEKITIEGKQWQIGRVEETEIMLTDDEGYVKMITPDEFRAVRARQIEEEAQITNNATEVNEVDETMETSRTEATVETPQMETPQIQQAPRTFEISDGMSATENYDGTYTLNTAFPKSDLKKAKKLIEKLNSYYKDNRLTFALVELPKQDETNPFEKPLWGIVAAQTKSTATTLPSSKSGSTDDMTSYNEEKQVQNPPNNKSKNWWWLVIFAPILIFAYIISIINYNVKRELKDTMARSAILDSPTAKKDVYNKIVNEGIVDESLTYDELLNLAHTDMDFLASKLGKYGMTRKFLSDIFENPARDLYDYILAVNESNDDRRKEKEQLLGELIKHGIVSKDLTLDELNTVLSDESTYGKFVEGMKKRGVDNDKYFEWLRSGSDIPAFSLPENYREFEREIKKPTKLKILYRQLAAQGMDIPFASFKDAFLDDSGIKNSRAFSNLLAEYTKSLREISSKMAGKRIKLNKTI